MSRRGLPPIPKVVGANGKRPCRGCGAEIPPRFQTWCSKECRERGYWALSGFARARVFARDKGVCSQCGADSEKVERILNWLYRSEEPAARDAHRALAEAWQAPGTSGWGWGYGHLWEADHIVPLAEGGKNEAGNYRTLCVPCHKAETKALRGRLSGRSRQQVIAMPDRRAASGAASRPEPLA